MNYNDETTPDEGQVSEMGQRRKFFERLIDQTFPFGFIKDFKILLYSSIPLVIKTDC